MPHVIRRPKSDSSGALVGIWSVLLMAFVMAVLYLGRDVLIPLALAALITFLLSPLVGRLERFLGRVIAVLLVVLLLFLFLGGLGWILTTQAIDLAARLPDYQANIESRVRALQVPMAGRFSRLTSSLEELRKLPGLPGQAQANTPAPQQPQKKRVEGQSLMEAAAQRPVPVRLVESESRLARFASAALNAVLSPLGTGALVLLLVVFMLLKREDLRGRFIRLVGHGRISATAHAMEDASQRVARYLAMQLTVNLVYGLCVAVGLYFIGVPNAALWGVLAGILRFIPYVGPWIGAAMPLLLSFAVSSSWWTPALTLGLFVVLESINSNAVEPWLYGSSTGVSSIALIVAAVFWTWLWGPIGLVLATPLTVCLAVIGRHVPKLEFLSVLLSEEQALDAHEECYHRLVSLQIDEATEFIENYLKENSLTKLYDAVLVPVLSSAELDAKRGLLPADEHAALLQNVRELVEELGAQLPATGTKVEGAAACRVLILPARAARDEIAGGMLAQLLTQQGLGARNAAAAASADELIHLALEIDPEAICISVVAPTTVIQARHLATRLRARFSQEVKIVVGLWDANDKLPKASQRLQASGADEVVTSLAEAVVQLAKFVAPIGDEMLPARIPQDEEERLAEVERLGGLIAEPERVFDRVTKKLAKLFQVPMALVTLVDRDRQWFKSQFGLPEDLARERSTPRAVSICGHMIAQNATLVVEDLARDRRFANNPLIKARGFRFYAGAPLRGPGGFAIGSLCLLDMRPRKMTEHELRVLESFAEDLSEELKSRVSQTNATTPSQRPDTDKMSAVP